MKKLSRDFRVINIDMRGFGRSSYINEINSLFDLAEDIKLLLEVLKIDRCSIAGWSTGGGVCLCFGIKYPNFTEKIT